MSILISRPRQQQIVDDDSSIRLDFDADGHARGTRASSIFIVVSSSAIVTGKTKLWAGPEVLDGAALETFAATAALISKQRASVRFRDIRRIDAHPAGSPAALPP